MSTGGASAAALAALFGGCVACAVVWGALSLRSAITCRARIRGAAPSAEAEASPPAAGTPAAQPVLDDRPGTDQDAYEICEAAWRNTPRRRWEDPR